MWQFNLPEIDESDIDPILLRIGGERPYAYGRTTTPNADYIIDDVALELKCLNKNMFAEPANREQLIKALSNIETDTPVSRFTITSLPKDVRREFVRIMSKSLRGAIKSAGKQLKQTRTDFSHTSHSCLFLINNGLRHITHAELVALVRDCVKRNTNSIDSAIVAGLYLSSSGMSSTLVAPIDYVSLNDEYDPAFFSLLKDEWDGLAELIATKLVTGDLPPDTAEDTCNDLVLPVGDRVFAKVSPLPPHDPSVPMLFRRHRVDHQDRVVATTYPDLSETEWQRFKDFEPNDLALRTSYSAWCEKLSSASRSSTPTKPFVRVPIEFDNWRSWAASREDSESKFTIFQYATEVFNTKIKSILSNAYPYSPETVLAPRFVLVQCINIGSHESNDLSCICVVESVLLSEFQVTPIVEWKTMTLSMAMGVAGAHAIRLGAHQVVYSTEEL